MGSWLRLLLLLSLTGNVFAADDAKDLSSGKIKGSAAPLALLSQFKPLAIASGTFVQHKYFTVLKNPVISSGELFLDQALGFVWHTSKPIASTMILKEEGLFSIDHRQQQKQINNATPIASVLMSALSGDLAALETQFSLATTSLTKAASSNQTCIELTPKDAVIAKVMRVIELCGKDTVDHLVLFETSGNRTEIELSLTAVDELPKAIREQL
ncbi:outer membrane lipoprotein carrier protein LolA [Moritella sp. 28]|uniref:outer membrane lipoprotein carrier protein LolA n=1 Tax=Moritella sp. 28 TaxID=2746232 RepID=UPI001BA67D19|nr:outer membrane lipoprotein carrier protein LolA [Moritella sp. 28]QUM85760.1 outer membrane lipoprotein carrier protein LolA [Moritella sp. 28]